MMITTQAAAAAASSDTINGDLAPWRLNALRGAYLLLVLGLGAQVWPEVLLHHSRWELMEGVVQSMLAALSLLAILGLRQPLRMLPLLLFEVCWKAIWLIAVAGPKWASGQADAGIVATTYACLLVIIFPIVIPWGHIGGAFFRAPSARWH